jgi:hypothetical protein
VTVAEARRGRHRRPRAPAFRPVDRAVPFEERDALLLVARR